MTTEYVHPSTPIPPLVQHPDYCSGRESDRPAKWSQFLKGQGWLILKPWGHFLSYLLQSVGFWRLDVLPWEETVHLPEQSKIHDKCALLDPSSSGRQTQFRGQDLVTPDLFRPTDVASVWWHLPPNLDTGFELLSQQT